MKCLKNKLQFLRDLRANTVDHGDIFAFQIIPIMRKLLHWWPNQGDQENPPRSLILFYAIIIIATVNYVCSFAYFLSHRDEQEVTFFFQALAYCVVGFADAMSPLLLRLLGRESLVLLEFVNGKNAKILRRPENLLEHRRRSNRIFLRMLCVWIVGNFVAFMSFPEFLILFRDTGDVFYKNIFFDNTPYSVQAFFCCVAQIISIQWNGAATTSFLVLVAETTLRISFFFDVLSQQIHRLRRTENFCEYEELRKFQDLSLEFSQLQWAVRGLNRTIRLFVILNMSVIFLTIGTFVVLMLWLDSSEDLLKVLAVPLYQFLFFVFFCVLGQRLSSSATTVRDAACDCNWAGAPLQFQEVLLNILTQTIQEASLQAHPFYDLNFTLLGTFLRKVYSSVAILRKTL